jgi:hypothetical protein
LYLTKGEIMYTLEKRTCQLDRWTVDSFDTFEELSEELEYLVENGWYVGNIAYTPSIDVSKCEAVAGDEDSFSNLGV